MKTVKITPPDGYEVDQDKSSFEEIVFKLIPKKKKLNVVTNIQMYPSKDVHINDRWAFCIYQSEEQGEREKGFTVSGHNASLYLADCHGGWYDKNGNIIEGYLYYKPNKEWT